MFFFVRVVGGGGLKLGLLSMCLDPVFCVSKSGVLCFVLFFFAVVSAFT